MQSANSANGTMTIILTLSESFALEMFHKPCGNGVCLPEVGSILLLKGGDCAMGDTAEHCVFISPSYFWNYVLDLPLCLLQQ